MKKIEVEFDGQHISADSRIPQQDLALYISAWGSWCRKCHRRWELSALLLSPECEWGDSVPLSEIMVVCSGCLEEINKRLKLKLKEDLGPPGTRSARSRKYAAAWNAPAHWYPVDHPAKKTRVTSALVGIDGMRRDEHSLKKSRRKPKSKLLGTVRKL